MTLTATDPRKQIAYTNGRRADILTIIAVVILTVASLLFLVAPAGAASIGSVALNESAIHDNVTSIDVSGSEQGSNYSAAESPEESTLTQSLTEEATLLPTEEVTHSTSASQIPALEFIIAPTPADLESNLAVEIQTSEFEEILTENPMYQSSGTPTLTTGDAEFVTESSAILTGTIKGGDPNTVYQIRFRYNIDGNNGKQFSQPINVKGNCVFEIPIANLRPGTIYIFRAIGGISDPYIPDASNCNSFKTWGMEPPGVTSSIKATIDRDLLDYFDQLLPDDGNCEYYNRSWEITPQQYKLMILAGMWAEGGKCGYSAHSSATSDSYKHTSVSEFVFSTGVGPMQVDRGKAEILGKGWENWSTIEKLDWKSSLESSLSVIYYTLDKKHNEGELHSIEDMRNATKNTWFGYHTEAEGNLGLWVPLDKNLESTQGDWYAVTGTTWDSVKESNNSTGTLLKDQNIILKDIRDNVCGEWDDYHNVVRKIGNLHWKITSTNIDGCFETYQVLSQRLYNNQNTYYYMQTESGETGTEIWAYYNQSDQNHDLKCIFVRDYNTEKEYPQNALPISTLGTTVTEDVIKNIPKVDSFTITSSNIKTGDTFTFNYKISAPKGASSVELWRVNDADKHDDGNIADDKWELIQSVQSTTEIGTIETISSVAGTYWYGLHVVDNSGAWACEKTPIRVTVFDDSHIPEVLSPEAGTQYDSDSVCVVINLKNIDIADKYEVVLSDGKTQKSKEYSSLPLTITDSEIWGSALPDGEYTVKYRYHFDENEQYGYSEGYSDFSEPVNYIVGEVEDKKILFDSTQPYTSVSIKLKESTHTASLSASGGDFEDLQDAESSEVYIYRGTTPLNISIADLSQPLPSGIVSSGMDSEDYILGDKVEIQFSKYGYATKVVNITLGETDNYTINLTAAMPDPGLTDLIAKRIFTPTAIRRGEQTYFNVEVINDGDVATGPFNVGLWFHNGTTNLIGTKEVSSIPAKESLVVNGWSVVWPADNESHPVIAWVDCDAVINETDEINNLFPGIGRASNPNETTTLRPPTLLSPANGSTIDDDTPTFTWSPVEGADYYCLNYSKEPYSSTNTVNELRWPSYTRSSSLANGNYRWNVASYNATTGWSSASPDSYFTLKFLGIQLLNPKDIEFGADGFLYVLDECNYQVQVFATNGTPIRRWGSYGSGAGEFGGDSMNGPWGLAVSPDGKVYVADTHNSRLQVFSSNGTYITQLRTWRVNDTVYSLWQPMDVAIDSSGNILVAMSAGSNSYVATFDSDLNFLRKWDTDDTRWPVKTIFADSHDIVYVNGYNKILKYTLEGELIGEIGPINYDPRGIYVDDDGTIYVACESGFKILSPTGSIVSGIVLEADKYGWPRDIVVGPHSVIYCASGFWSGSKNLISKHFLISGLIGEFNGTLPPIGASFAANVTTAPIPLAVQFVDASTCDPTVWSWDFGDGATSAEQNPVHTYTVPGTYNVSLTASNSGGSNTETKSRYVTVTAPVQEGPPAPVASFTANITSGTAPLTVGFTDTSTGNPTAWAWDFGDDTNTTVQNPVHTYTTPGNHTVNLTVSNAAGSNSARQNITVTSVVSPAITLSRGWNFISVPKTLSASNNNASTLFSSVDTGEKSILAYNTQTKTWTSITEEDIIQPLNGYWIYAAAETAIDLTYPSTSTSLPEKTLYPGWNAVGLSSGENTTADNALACLGSSWKTVIPWNLEGGMYDPAIINGGTGTYSPDRLMTLGNGYWVYVDTESTVIGLTA